MSTNSGLQFANANFSHPANGAKSASNRPKKPMRSKEKGPEQLNSHDVDVLTKQWEKDIWKKSIEQKGGDILNYENNFKAQLQMIENWEEKWNIQADEGLGWNGKDMFQSQVDAFLGDLSDNLEHRSQDGGVSFVRPSIHSGKEKDSHQDPAASGEVAEARLNSNHVEHCLKVEDKKRMTFRRSLRGHLEYLCKLLSASDPMSTVDTAALAASRETRILESAIEHTDSLSEYETKIEEAEQNLQEWKTYCDSTEGDGSDKKTGREFFLDYINQYPAHEVQTVLEAGSQQTTTGSAAEQYSHTDNPDDELYELAGGGVEHTDDASEKDKDSDADSFDDELYDLAGGNLEQSDEDSEEERDDVARGGLSSSYIEDSDDGYEIGSSPSPMRYGLFGSDSDDNASDEEIGHVTRGGLSAENIGYDDDDERRYEIESPRSPKPCSSSEADSEEYQTKRSSNPSEKETRLADQGFVGNDRQPISLSTSADAYREEQELVDYKKNFDESVATYVLPAKTQKAVSQGPSTNDYSVTSSYHVPNELVGQPECSNHGTGNEHGGNEMNDIAYYGPAQQLLLPKFTHQNMANNPSQTVTAAAEDIKMSEAVEVPTKKISFTELASSDQDMGSSMEMASPTMHQTKANIAAGCNP